MNALSLNEKTDPKIAVLIVVDMQNDFLHSEGAVAKMLKEKGLDISTLQQMVPRLVRFVEYARRVGLRIIYVNSAISSWDISEVWAEVYGNDMIVREGSWGAGFYEGISPQENERVVLKQRYSGFVGTNLDLILRSLGAKTVIMTGVATNCCVESTARDAFQRDYRVIFVSDLTATFSDDMHRATLQNIAMSFGTVVSSEEVLSAWSLSTG